MSTNMTDIRSVPLAALQLSSTPAQIERRAHLDKAKLTELAASIKSHGLVQPILVRPFRDEMVKGECFEVVAGERRVLAARQAGLEEIAATIRELTDEQVLELQLIENLQRQDLHELAEAEGYEALQKLGHSIDDMAAKVGKSRGTIYARMKLLALCKPARGAFYDGKISASIALLLARIPHEDLQKQALKEVLEEGDGFGEDRTMSYREAQEHIHNSYMLRLKEAPFPVGDEKLVPAAGSCFHCPKNTAQQRELFSDVKNASAGVCTDTVCFKSKREAWGRRSVEQAKATGQKVIEGAEANKIAKHGTHSLAGGYVKLDEHCYSDSKQRTYRQILGKSATPALLRDPKSGDVIEVVQKKVAEDLLPKRPGSNANDKYAEQQRAAEKKRKRETEFRQELFTQIRLVAPSKLDRCDLNAIAEVCFMGIPYEAQKQLLKAWGWTDKDDKQMDPHRIRGERLKEEIEAHSDSELLVFLLDCVYAEELAVSSYGAVGKPERLLAAAKRLKIDPEKIRKGLTAAEKAKAPAPAKAAKKKASRK